MSWVVTIKDSAIEDLRWFGKKMGRLLLESAIDRLRADPEQVSRNMKTLRPNPMAQRELRLFGRFRILFNLDQPRRIATILVVGEKHGNALIVQGKEFIAHHEGDPTE